MLLGCSSSSGVAGPGGSSDAGGTNASAPQDDAAAGDASSGQDGTTEAGPEDSAAGEGSSPLDSGVVPDAGAGEAGATIEVDPPPGRTVTTAPLFVPSTNTAGRRRNHYAPVSTVAPSGVHTTSSSMRTPKRPGR